MHGCGVHGQYHMAGHEEHAAVACKAPLSIKAPTLGAPPVQIGDKGRQQHLFATTTNDYATPYLSGPLDPGGDTLHPLAVGCLQPDLQLGPAGVLALHKELHNHVTTRHRPSPA